MTKFLLFLIVPSLLLGLSRLSLGNSQDSEANSEPVNLKVGVIIQPYTGSRGGPELSSGPGILAKEVGQLFGQLEIDLTKKEIIKLTPEEEKEYGVWHRVGLANRHLGESVSPMVSAGIFPLGLLGNCNSLWGMLAGLQHSGSGAKPLKIGFIWMDAHGDFNTPETTLSGMLGGMPVAVAAGKCLFRLRLKAGLDPAISTRHIIMMGLRDVDPLEQVLIEESHINVISSDDMIKKSTRMLEAVKVLSQQVDAIYVHIDLDVLDAKDIPGHSFEVPDGPSASQLGDVLYTLMQYKKVKALGIASFPTTEAGRSRSMASTLTLIKSAVEGLKKRNN